MPEPSWTIFVLALVLVAAIEWEEIGSGFGATTLGRLELVLVPVVYVALASWIFIVWPLRYAGEIRSFAETACALDGGLDEDATTIVYAGHRWRSGKLWGGPPDDEIAVRCRDGAQRDAIYLTGRVVAASEPVGN